MKRLLLVLVLLLLLSSLVSAQFVVGARGGVGFAFNKFSKELSSVVPNLKSTFPVILGVYGGYYFGDKLSLITGITMGLQQGMETTQSSPVSINGRYVIVTQKEEATFPSIDIPLIVRYKLLNGFIGLGLEAGAYISFPFEGNSKVTLSASGYQDSVTNTRLKTRGVNFGALAGLFAEYNVGPGSVVLEANFMMDFTEWESSAGVKMFSRMAVPFTVGYEYKF